MTVTQLLEKITNLLTKFVYAIIMFLLSLFPQVGHLAMETLLSLTSKRAGEWFKEELRVLGGVDHIVRTIQDCAARLEAPSATWTSADVDVLRKADRCLRVLENVSAIK